MAPRPLPAARSRNTIQPVKTVDGWTGLFEDLCAPADEVEKFDRLVRDPAGGVIH